MRSKISGWLEDKMIWIAIALISYGVFFLIRSFFPTYPNDNPVEEAIEYVIEENTGVEIDLTPSFSEQP